MPARGGGGGRRSGPRNSNDAQGRVETHFRSQEAAYGLFYTTNAKLAA
jgi:hypothetical protein